MRPDRRHERIIDLVREHQRMTVEALAEMLKISRETVRRDLSTLAEQGLIKKFHGGAARTDIAGEDSYRARLSEHVREKRAIARHAAQLFNRGDSLFVDAGTTTALFAEELARRAGITVITNSIAIAQITARGSEENKAFLIGGEYADDVGENVGALAVEQLQRFHATHAVITVGAVDRSGIMDFQLNETEVARAMVERARMVTVIADSSKLGRPALFQVCSLDAVDRLVVDASPDNELGEALRLAGVEVLIAPRLQD